jgi:hypothetical protein
MAQAASGLLLAEQHNDNRSPLSKEIAGVVTAFARRMRESHLTTNKT